MLSDVINIAKQAGKIIMKNYDDLSYTEKIDKSPVTKADLESSSFICNSLSLKFNFPVLSEEKIIDFDIRKKWVEYWLIDPLDGTKDFLTKNGEFSVNIALIKNRVPILGVVYAPAIDDCWWASKGKGSYKNGVKISNSSKRKKLLGLDSRQHQTKATSNFFKKNNINNIIKSGSSIKMCKIAEGAADIYPRLNGTKEWDTAAAEIILNEADCTMLSYPKRSRLKYNKKDLNNPFFVAFKNGLDWK